MRRAAGCTALALALTLLVAPTALGADRIAAATPLAVDVPVGVGGGPVTTEETGGYGIEAGEFRTPLGESTCDGRKVVKTSWYRIVGDGERITVSTRGSSFDTLLSVYAGSPSRDTRAGCNNDVSPIDQTSQVTFPSQLGATYLVQAGGCAACVTQTGASTRDSGTLKIVAFSRPRNDARSSAQPIAFDTPVTQDNVWASMDDGETAQCDGVAFESTVWFRVAAPAPGEVAVELTSAAPAFAAVQHLRTEAVVACARSAGAGTTVVLRAPVAAGQYRVQVGTAGGEGPITLRATFTEDIDLDDDGVPRRPEGTDCNDRNPAIAPGRADIPNNGVDEDCAGGDARDDDRDGYPRGLDCDDRDAAIRPGGAEVPGTFIDENCDKVVERGRLRPKPRVILATRKGRRARVRSLRITNVRAGYRIEIACRAKGCPRRYSRTVATGTRSLAIPQLRGTRLGRGAVITVRVWVASRSANVLGESTTLRIVRGGRVRTTTGCLLLEEGTPLPTRC